MGLGSEKKRRTLWLVLLLNAAIAIGFFVVGYFSDSNGGIIIADVVVMTIGANWPDLIVGIAVAAIAAYGGIEILRETHMDKHEEEGAEHGRGT